MNAKKRKVYKWLLIALCLVVVAVGGHTTQSLSVTKRGVVIGMGLDRTEEGYLVSAQMMQAGGGNSPEATAMYEVIVGEGATLREAMASITKKTSLYPSYAHCKVLFLGDEMLDEGLDDVLLSLMQNNDLGNVQVVATAGTAYKAITATVAISPTTSAYLERDNILVSKFGGRRLVSLKDYCQRIDCLSGNKFLPYAVMEPAEKPTGGEDSQQKESPVLFNILHTAAFDCNNKVHYYGEDITLAVGLVETEGGQLTAYDDEGRFVTVKINAAHRRRSYRPKCVEGHYRYDVSVVEQNVTEGDLEAEVVERLVAVQMENKMRSAYETCKADGVDIFSVSGHLYKRYGQLWPLEECRWERHVEVKCK